MQGLRGGTCTGGLPQLLTLSLAVLGLGNLGLPRTGRGEWRMGLGEEGGEEGDAPRTLLPLRLWVRRGFDGAAVGRETPQSPAPWGSWWFEHVIPSPGPVVPGSGNGPRDMVMGEKVGEADRNKGRAIAGVAPASSEAPSSSPPSSSSPSPTNASSSPLPTNVSKASPIIWGMGGGATGDQRGKEESLCKGDSTGREEVMGRDLELRELGKGGGEGRGVEKLGKEESREKDPSEWWSHRGGRGRLIMWEGKGWEEGEVRGGSQVGKGVEEECCPLTWAVLERERQGKHVRLGEIREGRRGGNVRTLYTLALPPVEGSRDFTCAGV